MDEILIYFPKKWSDIIKLMKIKICDCREIRMRINRPVIIRTSFGEVIVGEKEGMVCTCEDLHDAFEAINGYSIYAHMDSIKKGYITVKGGHRVGFCGHAVTEDGKVMNINNISSLNFRISHQIKGVADKLLDEIIIGSKVCNTLIVSPPGMGKTTLLREIVRNLKDFNVAVVDERGEIAGMYEGVPANDLGMRTDVIDGIDKYNGISMMIKSMSPQVMVLDEIGSESDVDGIKKAMKSGCSVIATAHGQNMDDIQNNIEINQVCRRGFFEKYIIIKKVGDYCIWD